MKKSSIIGMLICVILTVLLFFAGCTHKNIIDKTIVDKLFIEEHFETITEYKHIWDLLKNDWILVPEIKTKLMPDEWKLQIEIAYDDGTKLLEWVSVDENIFYKYEINDKYEEIEK